MRAPRKQANPIYLLIFSVLMIVIGISGQILTNKIESVCTSSTTGTIIENQKHSRGRSGIKYTGTVSFTANGMSYTVRTSESRHYFTIGEKIMVRYDPDDPSEAYCPDYYNDYWVLIVAGVIIMVVSGIGVYKRYYIKENW